MTDEPYKSDPERHDGVKISNIDRELLKIPLDKLRIALGPPAGMVEATLARIIDKDPEDLRRLEQAQGIHPAKGDSDAEKLANETVRNHVSLERRIEILEGQMQDIHTLHLNALENRIGDVKRQVQDIIDGAAKAGVPRG